MEQTGNIIVVAAILAVIMAGLFICLFFLDRKVKRLEREMKERQDPSAS